MWIRCIFSRKYYRTIISPCFLETLASIWWVHSLLMFCFHLQGFHSLWKVLNYSNLGCSWAHEAKAGISLEHPLSAERTSGQVDMWLCHSHACSLFVSGKLHYSIKGLMSRRWPPRSCQLPEMERSDPASWRTGAKFFLWLCVNVLPKVYLALHYHCGGYV